ncbi:hypothetical protein B0H21DRAFT_723235 [Amylocystis lapponica]|nr:hypothetical protein B0H21DRAFT_723235 [Amylocystis lapponica]
MNASKPVSSQLNYFQQSPVRGQLESLDGYSKTGWRYIQCTDTPNELRVLLPPRTALFYSQLLKAEATELAKDKRASWNRIVEIRHLKDRMIRKCQRLARASTPKDKQAARVMFQTVHAPPDFRLKEMERWFRVQDVGLAHGTAEGGHTSAQFCSICELSAVPPSRPTPVPASRRGHSPSSRLPPAHAGRERIPRRSSETGSQTLTYPDQSPSPPKQRSKPAPARPDPGYVPRRSMEERRPIPPPEARFQTHVTHADARSPEPIPIPFRTHRPPVETPPLVAESPLSQSDDLPPSFSPSPPVTPPEQPPSPPNGRKLPTIPERSEAGDELTHRPVPRRRSSLKKSNSMSRLSIGSQSKSVAWAMDRDWIEQMSQYIKATNEAEVLGHELEETRVEYHEDVEAMKGLCREVTHATDKVRAEMDNLYRSEEAVRKQETKLALTSEQLAAKEAQFRAKVLAVLEETKRVVALCDKKRDIHEV